MLKTFLTLREDGAPVCCAIRNAFYLDVTRRFLPHRRYLAYRLGERYEPYPMEWVWRGHTLWRSKDWPADDSAGGAA